MPVSILVRLDGGRYDAGGERPSESEWPPHPARAFCALVASAESDADWSALRWLEQQGPPQVWADPESRVHRSQTRAWVVENAIRPDGGNLNFPARNNGFRARAFAVPSRESFAIVWPAADPAADTLSRLSLLAWKVPYVGRSTGSAQVSVVGVVPAGMAETVIYEPAVLGRNGRSWDLRVPYGGYLEALRCAYADGRRSWEVARAIPYTTAQTGHHAENAIEEPEATAGPFGDLLVWGIERPVIRIGGDLVVSLAGAMRRTVLSLVGADVPDIPGQVSGHTQPGRTHLAFLALPDVGHAHADGHVLGLALALPRDMPGQDLDILLRSVLREPELKEVRFSSGRPLAVSYGSDRAGLRPSRWAAHPGEREWVSVTPVMLDGHTRRGRDEASEVARSLVIAGYPQPADVEVSAAPIVTGGIWRPRHGSLPSGRPRRQMVHARIRFHQPVIGPVLAGSMRYLGLGLFLAASRLPSFPARQPGLAQAVRQSVLAAGENQRREPEEVSR
jgi:CRISPR-associated protein Csb2